MRSAVRYRGALRSQQTFRMDKASLQAIRSMTMRVDIARASRHIHNLLSAQCGQSKSSLACAEMSAGGAPMVTMMHWTAPSHDTSGCAMGAVTHLW